MTLVDEATLLHLTNPDKSGSCSMSVTLSQLESRLWKAAWLLNGPIDAADCKTCIFPLLFFKRLSDVNDEEHAAALTELPDEQS